jgi:hypothetical protein
MPVILARREAEIRRITVQSHSRAKSSRNSILKIVLVEWLKW